MESYASIVPFSFAMAVIGSTSRPTTVNKLAVTDLQRITTSLFVALDMFALVFPYFFAVWLVEIMTDTPSNLFQLCLSCL